MGRPANTKMGVIRRFGHTKKVKVRKHLQDQRKKQTIGHLGKQQSRQNLNTEMSVSVFVMPTPTFLYPDGTGRF